MSATATKTKNNLPSKTKKAANDTKPQSFPRKTYIEVMRIIAAFLVIVNHTNSDVFLELCEPQSFTWYFSLTYFYISKIAVPVFFMIMGGLLLQKIDKPKKSVERVVRMVIVTVLFSLLYYLKALWKTPENIDVLEFLRIVFTIHTTNAYWYIYAYIGLLILLPLMQRMAHAFSKKATMYFVILSMGVLGFIPLMNIFFKITPHHYVTDSFFPVHLGIVFMGYYIEKYMKIDKKAFIISIFSFVLLIAFQVITTDVFYNKNPESYLQLDNWKYLTITLTATCFYIIFKYISTVHTTKESISKVLCYLGSLTFGIYLISDMMISLTRGLYANLQQDCSIMLATIIWEILIFVFCGAVTVVLKFIPGLKKLL